MMIKAADWVVCQLTGKEKRNSCTAGYKAIWSKRDGFHSKDYFASLHPALTNVIEDKLSTDIYPVGECAGGLPVVATQSPALGYFIGCQDTFGESQESDCAHLGLKRLLLRAGS